jgi:hypothetical protein
VAAFQDPARAFSDREHARTMARDHHGFIGVMHGYRVERDGPVADPPGAGVEPAAKLVVATWLRPGADPGAAPPDPPDPVDPGGAGAVAHRVVARRVVEAITPDAPRLVGVRELTCATPGDLEALAGPAARAGWDEPVPGVVVTRHVLREHVQRAWR